MSTDNPRTGNKGKGGNFDIRPNPFGGKSRGSVPSLADHSTCGLTIDRVLAAGDAIILGSTRDGGALCITLLVGDQRYRSYASSDQELAEALNAIDLMYLT